MKQIATPLKLIATVALAGALPASVMAQTTVSVTSQSNFLTQTVNDTVINTPTTQIFGGAGLTFNQFNADTGVLTGATLGASFNNPVSLTVSGTPKGGAQFTEKVELTTTNGSVFVQSSPTTINKGASAPSQTITLNNYGGSVAVTALDDLVGSGTVSATDRGSLTAELLSNIGTTTATVAAHRTNGSLNYTYLDHANASFSGASDVNAGAVSLGTSGSQNFDLFALAGSHGASSTTYLDQVGSWLCVSGDCAAFSVGSGLTGLTAGGSNSFSVLANFGGVHSAVFSGTFGDSLTTGAASSHKTESLTLTVTEVPEPGSLALFAAGIAALGAVSRRRRVNS